MEYKVGHRLMFIGGEHLPFTIFKKYTISSINIGIGYWIKSDTGVDSFFREDKVRKHFR